MNCVDYTAPEFPTTLSVLAAVVSSNPNLSGQIGSICFDDCDIRDILFHDFITSHRPPTLQVLVTTLKAGTLFSPIASFEV
jgi:hypothetical protein